MKKSEATKALGKNEAEAARSIGITAQAYSQWPDDLPQRLIDRVQAALYRKAQQLAKPSRKKAESTNG